MYFLGFMYLVSLLWIMEKVTEKKIKKLYTKTDIIIAIENIRQKRLTISASSKYNIFYL